jgi:glycosyltransferase involved in cell wall biosynthesis
MTLPELLPTHPASSSAEEKPRLLYIITRANRGGAQIHVLDMARAIRDDFDVSVATGEDGFLVEQCRALEIPVYIIPHLQRRIWPPTDALALWELGRFIRRTHPDIVHTHTFKAGFLGRIAARLLGVPAIYTMHTWLFGTDALPWIYGLLGAPCERLGASCGSRLLTVAAAGTELAHRYTLAPDDKVVTIHNGIPDSPCRAVPGAGDTPVITMVARFMVAKEHSVLLRAFAKLPSGPRLRLIGGGPLLPACKSLATELGIADRVDFLGERDDVPEQLASSGILVLVSKFEMFALSILEAMRAGLPVIASDVGGNSEAVIDGETGFLVPQGSVEALSRALLKLTQDAELRADMGRAARRRYLEHFTFERQLSRTVHLYYDVLRDAGKDFAAPARQVEQTERAA